MNANARTSRSVWIALAVLALPTLASAQTPTEVQCIEKADRDTPLEQDQRDRLCLGAVSLEPIACYRKALEQTPLAPTEAIDLCRCTTSAEPVDCFREALRARPDDELWALRQCSPITARNLTADCRPVVATDPGLR